VKTLTGHTDCFISPVSGEPAVFFQLPRGNVWTGDRNDHAVPSLKLIDLRIDVNSLYKAHAHLENNTFILNRPSLLLPHAQALSQLGGSDPRLLKSTSEGVIQVAIPDVDYATQALLEQIEAQCEIYKDESEAAALTSTTQATIATTQAGIAITQAGLAAASASASAVSAGLAASSASAAGVSAGLAAASALSASSSASNAATSETNAANSATSASSSATSAADSLNTFLTTNLVFQGDITGIGLPSSPIPLSFSPNPIIPGTGSITLPVGTVAQRPNSPLFGMIRANSDSSVLETYMGSSWVSLNTSSATVSSVGISGSTGLSVSGSPITSSGTISLTLGTELQALSGLSVTGIIVRTGSASYTPRTLTAGTGINIANPDGVAGNPTISLGTVPIANLSGYPGTSTQLLRGNGTWATPSLSDFNPPASGSTINFNNATITNFGNSSNTLTLNGSTVYANGAFAVSGSYATSLGGTLAVTGATTLSNNLTVSGNYSTYLGGTLSVVGITYLNGGLIANTGCIFTGGVTLNNTLTVSGNYATSLGGTLAVTGTTTLSSTLTASAGVVVGNTLFPPTGGIYVTSVIGTSVIGFAYYKLSGTSAVTGYWSSSGLPLSIQCTNAIAAVEFEATSSIKKKNILENRDSFQDELVNKFDSLDFVKYEWKDKHKEGAGDYFGYIAENVAEQFPSLVNLDHLEYAPSIMKMATLKVIDSATCEISFEEDVDIPLDAKIKFLRPDDQKEWEGVVVTEDNPHTYVLSVEREGLSDGEIFVYGTYEKVPLVSKTRFHDMVAARMRILIDEVNLLSQKVSRLEAQRT